MPHNQASAYFHPDCVRSDRQFKPGDRVWGPRSTQSKRARVSQSCESISAASQEMIAEGGQSIYPLDARLLTPQVSGMHQRLQALRAEKRTLCWEDRPAGCRQRLGGWDGGGGGEETDWRD